MKDPRADPRVRIRLSRIGHQVLDSVIFKEIGKSLRARRIAIEAGQPDDRVDLLDRYIEELRKVQRELRRVGDEEGWETLEHSSRS